MTAPGGPEVLQLQDLPVPQPGPGDLRVRLKAAGVNPIDTKLRSRGPLRADGGPHVLGCDGAGLVEAVGAEVRTFQPGDAVYFCWGGLGGPGGNYAEYAVVPARSAVPKPESLSFAEAAAAPLVCITAWEALRDRGRIAAGQRVLVHAGAGGVGHVAVQLVRQFGAIAATTVSTPDKAEFVTGLGCDREILYRQEDFVRAVLGWTGGRGADLAFDTVGGDLLERTFPAVKPYGDVVTILEPAAATRWKEARSRNLRVGLELMLTPQLQQWADGLQHQAEILAQCAALCDRDRLRIHLDRTFPLAEAAEAHRLLGAGSMLGKIALTMDD